MQTDALWLLKAASFCGIHVMIDNYGITLIFSQLKRVEESHVVSDHSAS